MSGSQESIEAERLAIERERLRVERAMMEILVRQYNEMVWHRRRASRSLWGRFEDALFDW